MPKIYLTKEMRLRENLVAWIVGQMKVAGKSQKKVATEMGLTQQGLCKKLKRQSITFDDLVFFLGMFQPDADSIIKLVGADAWTTKG